MHITQEFRYNVKLWENKETEPDAESILIRQSIFFLIMCDQVSRYSYGIFEKSNPEFLPELPITIALVGRVSLLKKDWSLFLFFRGAGALVASPEWC